VITTIITLVLMLPTTVYVHLRLPQIRRSMEGITILPIVIPPIVLIIGVLKVAPGFLLSTPYLLALVYVILAMPFAYRSLDAGLRAFDLKTMVEASNSLGAGWPTTLWRVVLPNIRTAMLSATVLTVALVLGEFTMASLALYVTFPVWIVQFEQNSGPVSTAASLLALFVTWLLLMLIVTVGGRGARKRGGAQVALFTVASLLCGLSTDIYLLIAFRAIQAIGGGALLLRRLNNSHDDGSHLASVTPVKAAPAKAAPAKSTNSMMRPHEIGDPDEEADRE